MRHWKTRAVFGKALTRARLWFRGRDFEYGSTLPTTIIWEMFERLTCTYGERDSSIDRKETVHTDGNNDGKILLRWMLAEVIKYFNRSSDKMFQWGYGNHTCRDLGRPDHQMIRGQPNLGGELMTAWDDVIRWKFNGTVPTDQSMMSKCQVLQGSDDSLTGDSSARTQATHL